MDPTTRVAPNAAAGRAIEDQVLVATGAAVFRAGRDDQPVG